MKAYMRAYVQAWDKAYRGRRLTKLAKLTDGVLNWEHLAKRLRDDKNLVREAAGEFSESLQDIVRSVAMGNYTDEGTAWESSETNLNGWFSDVIGESWKTGKWVTGLLPPPAADKAPWGVIATGFKGTWDNLVRGIEGNYNLADRRDRGAEHFESIPWGSTEDLQTKYGLTDERLTKELLEFERWAGKLLDARLTELLIATQGAELGNLKPDPASGWPFLGLAPNPLATVQYEKFKNLLREVEKTRVAFEKLESGLGKGEAPPGYKDRQAFYTACSRWQEFLKADAVDVTVVPCSIGQAPGGGWPQNIKSYCRDVADSIKLQLGGRGQLDFSCESQHWDDSKITWNFKELTGDWLVSINARSEQKSSDTKNAKDPSKVIHLVEKTKLQKLGEDSALALCAYLERYGKPKDDRKTWYVVHGFDAEVGGAKPEAYGAVLRFDFGKTRLPEPIPKLEPVKTPEPPKWDDVSTGPR
jgi:hypothetical protein